jgi:hypothetical protein
MNFITLPSGVHINADKLVWYYSRDSGVRYQLDGDSDPSNENMSLTDFQNLLRGPEQSPIVEPVINLDRLKPGSACCFTYEGTVKHGIVSEFGYSNGAPFIKMIHDGDYYTKFLNTGEVI